MAKMANFRNILRLLSPCHHFIIQSYRVFFSFLDRNKDTRIQTEELAPLLSKVGFGDVGSEGVEQIIQIFDDNGDGEMDLLEFCEFFSYIFKTLVKRRPKSTYTRFLISFFYLPIKVLAIFKNPVLFEVP